MSVRCAAGSSATAPRTAMAACVVLQHRLRASRASAVRARRARLPARHRRVDVGARLPGAEPIDGAVARNPHDPRPRRPEARDREVSARDQTRTKVSLQQLLPRPDGLCRTRRMMREREPAVAVVELRHGRVVARGNPLQRRRDRRSVLRGHAGSRDGATHARPASRGVSWRPACRISSRSSTYLGYGGGAARIAARRNLARTSVKEC